MKIGKLTKNVLLISLWILVFAVNVQAAEERKSLDYMWTDKNATIYFYNELSAPWKESISAAMTKWNAVKDARTGKDIVPFALTSDSSNNNRIYSTGNQVYIAYCSPNANNGVLSSVNILVNIKDYSFASGSISGKYDMQSTIIHELGHAIGVAHCHENESCFSTTCATNVMNPTLSDNMTRRNLTAYDTSSKQYIYW